MSNDVTSGEQAALLPHAAPSSGALSSGIAHIEENFRVDSDPAAASLRDEGRSMFTPGQFVIVSAQKCCLALRVS